MTETEAEIVDTSRDVVVRGLRLRLHGWKPAGEAIGPRVLVLHGFLDSGATFEALGSILAEAGLEVVAPDLRGFGDSDRVGAGGYYHFPDYVADVAELADLLAAEAPAARPLAVVGHSMGGGVATLFAGALPDRVARLAVLEGWGPMHVEPELGVDQMRRHLADLRKVERTPRTLASLEDATTRLAASHPRVDREILAGVAEKLVRRGADGTLTWAWDPLHRTTSPITFNAQVYGSFLRAIACPVLSISGGPHGFHPPDEEQRLREVRRLRRAEIPTAGHMMHWTAPHAVAALLVPFLLEAA
jgi:pimeloyl-ACP methyl ester carboxylesterase